MVGQQKLRIGSAAAFSGASRSALPPQGADVDDVIARTTEAAVPALPQPCLK